MQQVKINGKPYRAGREVAGRWDSTSIDGFVDAFPARIDSREGQLIVVTDAALLLITDQADLWIQWDDLVHYREGLFIYEVKAAGLQPKTVGFRLDGELWPQVSATIQSALSPRQGAAQRSSTRETLDRAHVVDLGPGGVTVEDQALVVRGPADRPELTARLPLLVLSELVAGSASAPDPALNAPDTIGQLRIWNGPALVLRSTAPGEVIDQQRAALARAGHQVGWDQLLFPMSAARAEAVRRQTRAADVPVGFPGLTDLFRDEFTTLVDSLPQALLTAWRQARPDIGTPLAILDGAGTYLVAGTTGAALGRVDEPIRWAPYTDLALPVGAATGEALDITLRTRDSDPLGTITVGRGDSNLGQTLRYLTRRVLGGMLAGLPLEPVTRLEWAQRQYEGGIFDQATLALAVQTILDPKVAQTFPENFAAYPPQPRSLASRPTPAPALVRPAAPPATPVSPPAARQSNPRQVMQTARSVGVLAGLAAAVFDDE